MDIAQLEKVEELWGKIREAASHSKQCTNVLWPIIGIMQTVLEELKRAEESQKESPDTLSLLQCEGQSLKSSEGCSSQVKQETSRGDSEEPKLDEEAKEKQKSAVTIEESKKPVDDSLLFSDEIALRRMTELLGSSSMPISLEEVFSVMKESSKEEPVQKAFERLTGHGHVNYPYGITDISGEDYVIEIKNWHDWKEATGQLCVYGACYPDMIKMLAYFGKTPSKEFIETSFSILEKLDIIPICYPLGIEIHRRDISAPRQFQNTHKLSGSHDQEVSALDEFLKLYTLTTSIPAQLRPDPEEKITKPGRPRLPYSPAAVVQCYTLYLNYASYSGSKNIAAVSYQEFCKLMVQRGFRAEKIRGIGHYKGLRIRTVYDLPIESSSKETSTH